MIEHNHNTLDIKNENIGAFKISVKEIVNNVLGVKKATLENIRNQMKKIVESINEDSTNDIDDQTAKKQAEEIVNKFDFADLKNAALDSDNIGNFFDWDWFGGDTEYMGDYGSAPAYEYVSPELGVEFDGRGIASYAMDKYLNVGYTEYIKLPDKVRDYIESKTCKILASNLDDKNWDFIYYVIGKIEADAYKSDWI